ncbi:TWiK family of potassium channels protein 18 isoform X2 [Phlebotomus papatasi]|uniref:TWiK family of potassium channels protein 18 isoform X2 n=1 Tax=Phlebotomus papatasi TaxID=29031 RepID=UPI0024836986|nr:TWiK family of potassium channels protein 18 isoform X2 [Phlebotomus papatasi]
MGDKESGRYHCYDEYPPLKPNNTDSLKREPPSSLKAGTSTGSGAPGGAMVGAPSKSRKCCSCLGPKSAPFWVGLLTNLGICTLLFAYTLLGSFIFLAIEGGASTMQQKTLASTNRQMKPSPTTVRSDNVTFSPAAIQDTLEARQRAVENIWDITVSLNILYRENWTRLAALEIARFQEQLIKRLTDDMIAQGVQQGDTGAPSTGAVIVQTSSLGQEYDWTFARAFLYSLTVLTTIGYGTIAPKTTLGRIVTLAYAVLGIPLTLVYLSSTGGVLARVARGFFSRIFPLRRALCCCLCSNCGYCCYDEKRMAEKERRMKKKRQQEELRAQQMALQEPYYVRSGSLHNNLHSPEKQIQFPEIDSLSATESKASMHGLSLLAPILLCLCMMVIYIGLGAMAMYRLEGWPLLDGVYFCFMSLSTIGFGDLGRIRKESTTTTWFCSIYIMSGMALTAMCFNVLHEEIIHRIKHVVEIKKTNEDAEYGAS